MTVSNCKRAKEASIAHMNDLDYVWETETETGLGGPL